MRTVTVGFAEPAAGTISTRTERTVSDRSVVFTVRSPAPAAVAPRRQ
jgi:hypothetical protein